MTVAGITFVLRVGRDAAADAPGAPGVAELLTLRAEVCGHGLRPGGGGSSGDGGGSGSSGEGGGSGGDEAAAAAADAAAARQVRVRRRQPGFVLAEARHGGYLVAYASGLPLRPSTSWWKDLTTPLPADLTTEYPGRTFALTELIVRASWRRQGIGRAVHDLIMNGRPEERATLTVPAGAAAAQAAFRKWGWHRVARTRGPAPGVPVLDVLVTELRP